LTPILVYLNLSRIDISSSLLPSLLLVYVHVHLTFALSLFFLYRILLSLTFFVFLCIIQFFTDTISLC
uniref:Uncharacterized protein n=1 Tax=Amphimedon queenslandica TaxID=400682 RepID=A0A1X7TQ36_AMPQE